MKTALVTPSTGEALSLDDIKSHLRIPPGYTNEDSYLMGLRNVAVEDVESRTGRKLLRQVWAVYLDKWPDEDAIELPYPPFSTALVPNVSYTASKTTAYVLSSTKYKCDSVSEPGRIMLRYEYDWPSETLYNVNPIRVAFQCGYGASSTNIPHRIRQAMLMRVSDLYENREERLAASPMGTFAKNDIVDQLLAPFKVFHFGKEQE